MDARRVYALVLKAESVGTRLERASQSIITPWDDTGWIVKEDAPGVPPQVEWETRVYSLLLELGADDLAPEFDEDASDGCLVIKLINAAASLEDYAALFATRADLPIALWHELMGAVGRTVARFHSFGFVHGDLHPGNVVVGLQGARFRPYLIDFGLTQHEELGEYPHPLTQELSEEADLNRLDEGLRAISSDPRYLSGLEELSTAYYRY
jgi:hypothetical protein